MPPIIPDEDPAEGNTIHTLSVFLVVRFVSGVFLGVLAVVTITANIALLVTLWRRRERLLKTPTMIFILAIAVADLTTGLVVEPAFSICYISSDLNTCREDIMELVQFLPRLFLAVAHPHFYKHHVTKTRVTALVFGIFVYTLSFSFLQFLRISKNVLLLIDVSLHATLIPSVLMMSYIAILLSLRKHMRDRNVVLFRRHRGEANIGSESSVDVQMFPPANTESAVETTVYENEYVSRNSTFHLRSSCHYYNAHGIQYKTRHSGRTNHISCCAKNCR
ncbi:tyramine receptor 1-like [Acropora muricata]|uniref:tyramine receptor 1-like n=1 Tax=Acropora muricata TaxID=159855 RepID=UPI0034E44C9E